MSEFQTYSDTAFISIVSHPEFLLYFYYDHNIHKNVNVRTGKLVQTKNTTHFNSSASQREKGKTTCFQCEF